MNEKDVTLKKNISRNVIEISISTFTIVVFILFAYYMYVSVKKNRADDTKTFSYMARFNDVDGITVGSDVKIAGYKVGSVTEIVIVPESYDVRVTVDISDSLKIPDDSTLAVRTSGIIGSKFLSVLPGASEKYLNDNEEIIYTQSGINLEAVIGNFLNK